MVKIHSLLFQISLLPLFTNALKIDLDDFSSLQNATSLIAYGMMDYYNGHDYGQVIGMFAKPYYWWEAGGAWGCLLDYWYYMQNDTYNDLITEALLYQTGDRNDYVPLNQSTTEGNDDQAFWGIAAITAAERNFTNPPPDKPQWLYLAQAVFNTMALRWDDSTCNGGLRWQIFVWNSGYSYKNSVSNGALFHIAARLARYTGNQSYVEWADKIYDWMFGTGIISDEYETYKFVYDGANIETNCTDITRYQWTYNQGLVLAGCAYLYNHTQDEKWLIRTEQFLNGSVVFFRDNVIYEAACQPNKNCNNDQRSFKAYFARFLGVTAQLIPSTRDTIMRWINTSAYAAAQACSGGTDGHTCGMDWVWKGWDGYYGLGEQMAALEFMVNTRALDMPPPYTSFNGGSSTGSGAAGTERDPTNLSPLHITAGSKAGASIITCIVSISILTGAMWLVA
ncbi:hypothetical protein TBLA_0H02590 [Henningerozyma blattae CBS 6284]|uniref:Mannan endo-1,6-alpha-mannosidase n=1 Tax=Henningerozyma blattae (strain ATCC 34711 / CBS 6284 / DSM 70876 / NBRC 10599 / NRRL Y-10934 / UCD 77-7) TaxID=1071380 RepID=I2H841_HENB6|nr:hypothetical protein TBLA_0H02590 [Tetrapisispora blattae CBS 6284]CCH62543.1 hypothetical protein TBLA_0H02590 [Tetrapisispora blattae CBS 6284]